MGNYLSLDHVLVVLPGLWLKASCMGFYPIPKKFLDRYLVRSYVDPNCEGYSGFISCRLRFGKRRETTRPMRLRSPSRGVGYPKHKGIFTSPFRYPVSHQSIAINLLINSAWNFPQIGRTATELLFLFILSLSLWKVSYSQPKFSVRNSWI